jgi:hypothetical protein
MKIKKNGLIYFGILMFLVCFLIGLLMIKLDFFIHFIIFMLGVSILFVGGYIIFEAEAK